MYKRRISLHSSARQGDIPHILHFISENLSIFFHFVELFTGTCWVRYAHTAHLPKSAVLDYRLFIILHFISENLSIFFHFVELFTGTCWVRYAHTAHLPKSAIKSRHKCRLKYVENFMEI